jgi:hypothetical protein
MFSIPVLKRLAVSEILFTAFARVFILLRTLVKLPLKTKDELTFFKRLAYVLIPLETE